MGYRGHREARDKVNLPLLLLFPITGDTEEPLVLFVIMSNSSKSFVGDVIAPTGDGRVCKKQYFTFLYKTE